MDPIKPEMKEAKESVKESTTIVRQMNDTDIYIHDLIKSGPQSTEEIHIRDYNEQPGRHRMSLPMEIERKYSKKYAFRWVYKTKKAIDHALLNRRWVLVNRTLFSDMPKILFTANGSIENGDTILCFMPMAEAERLRRQPGELSRQRVKDLPMEKWKNSGEDSPFYKPTLGQEEKDGEVAQTGIQPDVQHE